MPLSDLDLDQYHGPFLIEIRDSVLTFRDPMDIPSDDVIRLIEMVETGSPTDIVKAWLTPEDFRILVDSHVTLNQLHAVIKEAIAHTAITSRLGFPQKRRRLIRLLDKYQPAVMADLQETYGVDLTAMWRLRRWSFIIDLVDQLPSHSRTTEAILNDEEIAEEILAQRESGDTSDGAWHPRFSEFGQTQQMLAQIIDQLSGLQATTVAAAGGDPKNTKPYPRPQSAVDRLKRKREQDSQNQILDLFGGGNFNNP